MQLADKESLVLETGFGLGPMGGTVTLTDRRVVFVARDYEESIPLRAITSVRCAFSRDVVAMVWGSVILLCALGFGAGYKSMETAANGLALSIEKRVTEKQPAGEAYGHYVDVNRSLVWVLMLPLMGWGAFKLGSGAIGRTEMSLATASETAERARYGRQRELMEFCEEVGRRIGASSL